jgi:hypothetical protein
MANSFGSETEEEKSLGARLDDSIETKSYEVIKISDDRIDGTPIYDKSNLATLFSIDKNLIENTIEEYVNAYQEPNIYRNKERFAFTKSKYRSEKIKKVNLYLELFPEDVVFTQQNPAQYCPECTNWINNPYNISIIDFASSFTEAQRSTYLSFLHKIPTSKVGSALYKVNVGEDKLLFRAGAKKRFWSWRDIYWGHVVVFSTTKGKEQAPLLVVVDDPNDRYLHNGSYIIIPKSIEGN